MLLELIDVVLNFDFAPGSQAECQIHLISHSNRKLADGEWHSAIATRTGTVWGSLAVDGSSVRTSVANHRVSNNCHNLGVDLTKQIYIGGHPRLKMWQTLLA
jgi:hypothetical protein